MLCSFRDLLSYIDDERAFDNLKLIYQSLLAH